jgi:3-carboxy-cis,cis-muconate cycloisomerase
MPSLPIDSEIEGKNFGTSEMRELFSDPAYIQFMLDVEAALARAESRLSLIPVAAADAITAAAKIANLDLGSIAASTSKVGYPVVALVKELGRVAGEEAARYIHLGATTQDITDTAAVLQIRSAVSILRRDLISITPALGALAKRYRDTPMAGRTHLQQAVPISFGLKCALWAAPLLAHLERLDQAARRVLVVQFGGAAGTVAPLGRDGVKVMEALARELGLGIPLAPWHSARDGLAEIVALLAMICGSLGKIALDVSLLAQSEVGEVSEPYEEGRGSSSTMPQKRNPISSEYIIAAARGVHALAPLMFTAMIGEHERSTGAWQSERLALPECFVLTAGALARVRSLAEGLVVDPVRMRANLNADGRLIMAEAVSTALTAIVGRTIAHEVVERASLRAVREHKSLRQTLLDDEKVRAHFSEAEIDRVLDPANYLGSVDQFVDRVLAKIEALT